MSRWKQTEWIWGAREFLLEKMGGMILLTESGGFFGTEWDDQTIRPGEF